MSCEQDVLEKELETEQESGKENAEETGTQTHHLFVYPQRQEWADDGGNEIVSVNQP